MRSWRSWLLGIAAVAIAGCAKSSPPPKSATDAMGATTTTTTSADAPLGPGYSGTTNSDINRGFGGTAYPSERGDRQTNPKTRPGDTDVRKASDAK